MFFTLVFACFAASTLAVRNGTILEAKNITEWTKPLACGRNRIAIGLTCKNNCTYVNLRCRHLKHFGPGLQVSSMGVCDSRSGSHLFVGFQPDLTPQCRILERNDRNKQFNYQCKRMTAQFDSGIGVNCPHGVISKVNVDRTKKVVSIACCRDNDHRRITKIAALARK